MDQLEKLFPSLQAFGLRPGPRSGLELVTCRSNVLLVEPIGDFTRCPHELLRAAGPSAASAVWHGRFLVASRPGASLTLYGSAAHPSSEPMAELTLCVLGFSAWFQASAGRLDDFLEAATLEADWLTEAPLRGSPHEKARRREVGPGPGSL